METTIPKIFHQIWFNGEMPIEHFYLKEHMLELHPGWEYKFWNEKNMPKIANQEAFDKWPNMFFKSDVLRYAILEKYGGVYVDTDFLFYKNIEECMQKEYLIMNEYDKPFYHGGQFHMINNCLIGAIPNSPLMKYVNYKIPENMQRYDKLIRRFSHNTTGLILVGPYFFDTCVEDIIGREFSYETKYFCPFRPEECISKQFDKFPEAYAAHLFNYEVKSKNIEVHKTLPCYKRMNS